MAGDGIASVAAAFDQGTNGDLYPRPWPSAGRGQFAVFPFWGGVRLFVCLFVCLID